MKFMTTSHRGILFLEQEEGKMNHAYPDPATGGAPWTIGVGHTGPEVHQGLYWDDAQIEAVLKQDLVNNEDSINACVKVPLTQDQFDALVSFAHNEGVNALPHGGLGSGPSTLLRKLNDGDYQGAADCFLDWHIAGGIPHFLDARRRRERALFLSSPAMTASLVSETYSLAKVQKFLGVDADGVMGPHTRAAVVDWQRTHDLEADGVVGPKTLAAMKARGLVL